MASQKKARSSKTSHVLSLLSGAGVPTEPQQEETEPEQAAQPQEEPKPQAQPPKRKRTPAKKQEEPPQQPVPEQETPQEQEMVQPASRQPEPRVQEEPTPRRTLTPPIVEVARANNEMLAETIKDALSQALEEEIAQQEQEQQAMAAQREQLQPHSEPKPPAPPQMQPEPEPQLQPKPQPKPEPQPMAAPMPDWVEQGRLPDGSIFINVMELLVDEKLDRYVKMFGLCDCLRCLADAKALALSRLQAKYVVLEENTRVPMLSFYEAKYGELVIPEVIHACKTVMEHPRHKIKF